MHYDYADSNLVDEPTPTERSPLFYKGLNTCFERLS